MLCIFLNRKKPYERNPTLFLKNLFNAHYSNPAAKKENPHMLFCDTFNCNT